MEITNNIYIIYKFAMIMTKWPFGAVLFDKT